MDEVPVDDYMIPLGKAEILSEGKDVTLVGWGAQVRVLEKVSLYYLYLFDFRLLNLLPLKELAVRLLIWSHCNLGMLKPLSNLYKRLED